MGVENGISEQEKRESRVRASREAFEAGVRRTVADDMPEGWTVAGLGIRWEPDEVDEWSGLEWFPFVLVFRVEGLTGKAEVGGRLAGDVMDYSEVAETFGATIAGRAVDAAKAQIAEVGRSG